MDAVNQRAVSRRLSFVLRHRPDSVGLTLAPDGWVPVADLLLALERHGLRLTRDELAAVVAVNDKQRFAFDETGERIRASQGHSVPVELGYAEQAPPAVLFHGTAVRNIASIMSEGLHSGRRHAVHLSADEATAHQVGRRRGKHVVLRIDAASMHRSGWRFAQSANGVWLVDRVPPEFITSVPAAGRPSR